MLVLLEFLFRGGYIMKILQQEIKNFESLIDYFKENKIDEIYKDVAISNYIHRYKDSEEFDERIMGIEVDGAINICKSIAAYKSLAMKVAKDLSTKLATVYDMINNFASKIDDYREVYYMLDDDISRKTFFNIIMYRLVVCNFFLDECRDDGIQYYRKELLEVSDRGVLLDCGSFNGDTAISYIKTYGENYKKIYMFEPDPKNIESCEKNTQSYDNIILHNAGVGNENGTLRFINDWGAGNRVAPNGQIEVSIVKIDDIVKEPVTFIKMDIEGSEMLALEGAKEHIIKDNPQLTICLYHLMEDIFEIPLYIKKLNSKQRFNIRYHGGVDVPEEIVLYAAPFQNAVSTGGCEDRENIIPLLDSIIEATDYISKNYEVDDKNYNELIDCIYNAAKMIKNISG